MKMGAWGLCVAVCVMVHAESFEKKMIEHDYTASSLLKRLSKHAVKIWLLTNQLVENQGADTAVHADFFDDILYRLVIVRQLIKQIKHIDIHEAATVEYVSSVLDCVESYTYDLTQRYPGSWSAVIKDQVTRVQDCFTRYLMPLITTYNQAPQ